MLDHIDLFSGIGGFALAARWAGLQTVQFVELDPFCQKVLAKNFKGVPIHDDIKTFKYTAHDAKSYDLSSPNPSPVKDDKRERGVMDKEAEGREGIYSPAVFGNQHGGRPFLLTGGFPCQPFSCAGKRRGKEDDRYLWDSLRRVISEAKPRWIILENVTGIFSILEPDSISTVEAKEIELFQQDENYAVNEVIERIHRRVLGTIISEIEEIGYDFPRLTDGTPIVLCLPACAVNAPHRRDRVWIVGHYDEYRNKGEIEEIPRGEGSEPSRTNGHAADTEGAGLERGNAEGAGRAGGWDSEHIISNSGRDKSRPWDEPWLEAATRLCRVDARVSNRVDRLKSLGNAIVPQIAYEIMKAIRETVIKEVT